MPYECEHCVLYETCEYYQLTIGTKYLRCFAIIHEIAESIDILISIDLTIELSQPYQRTRHQLNDTYFQRATVDSALHI